MKHSAVLFDLDGTLLDTLDDLADSMNAALARLGFPGHPVAAYRLFVGAGVENLARQALPADKRDKESLRACVVAMREEYGKRWADKTKPYPGVPELLAELSRMNVKTAVLSNKPDAFTIQCVERFLPGNPFAVVRGARPGVPLKPDPSSALAIARELNVPPACILYLGDSDIDMQTAKAAGMFPVGVLWGFRSEEELRNNGAAALLKAPDALLRYV